MGSSVEVEEVSGLVGTFQRERDQNSAGGGEKLVGL